MFSCVLHTILILFVCSTLYGRSKPVADSCLNVLYTAKNLSESERCDLLYKVILNNTNADTCIYYANRLIEIADKSNNALFLHRGYYEKGQGYLFKSQFKESSLLLLKSLDIARKNKLGAEEGLCYYILSEVFLNSNNTGLAINYLKSAITIFKKDSSNLKYTASAYYQLGNIYLKNEKLDSAFVNFNKSAIIFKMLKFQQGLAYSIGNLGVIQFKLNKNDSARINFLFAINELEKLGENNAIISYYLYLSKNENNQNLPLKALEYIKKAVSHASSNPDPMFQRDINEQLAYIYEQLGDYEKAYHYQKEFYTIRDSLINIDVVTQLANLRTEFEVGQKQAEVDFLSKLNVARNREVFYALLGLAVALVLLIFIMFGYYQKLTFSRKLEYQAIKLAEGKAEVEEVNNAKDRLFSVISHDLRAPVSALKSLASLVVQSLKNHKFKDANELAVSIQDTSQQIEFLLDNLLHWSISRQNLYRQRNEIFEINKLVRDVIHVYIHAAKTKQITLTFNPAYKSLIVESDQNCWATIIRNLVNNALKFTHIGGKIELSLSYDNGYVYLDVTDNGLGMNSEQVGNLFNFAGKISEWGTKNEKGQGLGLCLVNDFVNLQGGNVEVTSEPGSGSNFRVIIPAGLIEMGERVNKVQVFEK